MVGQTTVSFEALTEGDVYVLVVIPWMRVGAGTTLERRRRKERNGEKVKNPWVAIPTSRSDLFRS